MNQCFGDIQARVLIEVMKNYQARITELENMIENARCEAAVKTDNLRHLQSNLDLPECESCGHIGTSEDDMWFCSDCGCALCNECIAYDCSECETLLCCMCYNDPVRYMERH